ncbi:MAG TPA: phosphoribosylanthranilate isomerase, partial [Opitutaceae bacterium]|nr:phosphoribosylanthranilate isomerase [Opitutaceae bacterium]
DSFDFFQIHFRHDLPPPVVEGWAKTVGAERLWLAPRLPPAVDVAALLIQMARYILLDTFQADAFGGSGRTGDWAKFARHQQAHADRFWILSGGLNADNIGEALRATNARFIDVNSGVEAAPGVKDAGKLAAFVASLRDARSQSRG